MLLPPSLHDSKLDVCDLVGVGDLLTWDTLRAFEIGRYTIGRGSRLGDIPHSHIAGENMAKGLTEVPQDGADDREALAVGVSTNPPFAAF